MGDSKPYHHGNLRPELLKAGWEVLADGGLEALTLRAVARRAGVSHAAPAHHFRDKAALLEAMAIQGHERFAAALDAAWEQAEGTSLQRLGALGLAYVHFAQDHTDIFRLINRPELWGSSPRPDVVVAAQRTHAVLLRGIRACQDEGFVQAGNPDRWAQLAWSGVHGLAMLTIDGLIGVFPSGRCVDDLTQELLQAMGHGLRPRHEEMF